MFEPIFVQFEASTGSANLVGAPVVVDRSDESGVHRAAQDLTRDLGRVAERSPSTLIEAATGNNPLPSQTPVAIIVGSIESSSLLQQLEAEKKIDTSAIRGKWESFITTVIDSPFANCDKALVIAGSDKRGAIFGIYTLSEQIGVSPWYWWADVPPKLHAEIHAVKTVTTHGEPSVRYRGIFLNDEAPALTGWVLEKYGKYNSGFYKNVFELLLRLKANFLWPAMWPGYPNPGASFFVDDPENQKLANEYGIMVSTSHHEPMQRLSNEWFGENPDGSWNWLTNKEKITQFFEDGASRAKGHESYFTLGMRGEYDKKMACEDPAAVVQNVIDTQRQVIKKVYGKEDSAPQLFAVYKEVQSLFESGRLSVPEDVTLLFQDDNFGTIRRLPTAKESERSGGAGVYYHLEYVGAPRSYKWINSNSLGKVWHQMTQAYERNARQIWVFNVGDLKPLEVPITFAMALAYNVKDVKSNGLEAFFKELAKREFGPDLADEVAAIWYQYDRLASLRKHEHIEPETFSILHYNEADAILARWKKLLDQAEATHARVPEEQKAASFQLILHQVKASYIYVALQVTRAQNQLFARQRRNSANKTAQDALNLFDADFDLSEEFHALLNGKWNHMLMQTHYGYEETWHAPSRDMISGLGFVQKRQNSNPIVGQMGIAVEDHEGVRPGRINEESERTHPSRRDLVPGLTLRPMSYYGPDTRWFDIYTRGVPTIHWTASAPQDWVELSQTSGELVPGQDDARVRISVKWDLVPEDFNQEVLVSIKSEEGDFEHVHLPIDNRRVPSTFQGGLVEASGYVSIPATSADIKAPYLLLPDAGRLEGGSVTLVPDFKHHGAAADAPPHHLEYPFYLFSESTGSVELHFSTTLDFSPEDVMKYDLRLDGGSAGVTTHNLQKVTPESLKNAADKGWASADGWFFAASDNVWVRKHEFPKAQLLPGAHVLSVQLQHPNVVLEKIVIDCGGVSPSYLGPPFSRGV